MAGNKGGRGGKSWKSQLRQMAKAGQIPAAVAGGTQEQRAELFKAINQLYKMPNINADITDRGDDVYIRYLDGTGVTGRTSYPSGNNATQEEKDGVLKWALLNHIKRYNG